VLFWQENQKTFLVLARPGSDTTPYHSKLDTAFSLKVNGKLDPSMTII